MSYIYLAHVSVWNPVTLTSETLYLSSQGFVTGADNLPPGGAAHTCYNNRIKEPGFLRRSCWKDKTNGGESEIGYGAIVNINIDGGLDYLMTYGFDGREITLIRGELSEDTAPVPTWHIVFKGKMARPYFSRSALNLHLRDLQVDLNKPVCTTRYLANNVGSTGLEGGTELLNQFKPKIFGTLRNITPVCVNVARRIYQVNDGAVYQIAQPMDRGATLTVGAEYVSQADMEANSPVPGQFRAWPAGGYFRLGADPIGKVTVFQVLQSNSYSDRSAKKIITDILTLSAGLDSSKISASDLAALDLVQSATLGFNFSGLTCHEALDLICKSVGAWWAFDRLNVFRIKRFDAPTGTAVLSLSDVEIVDIEPVTFPWCEVPVWRSTIKYVRNYTIQDSDIASGVDMGIKTMLATDFEQISTSLTSAQAVAIKAAYPLAEEMVFETDFSTHETAKVMAENERRFNLYNVQRYGFKVVARLTQSQVALVNLGSEIKITLNRFLLNAGKNFIVLGIDEDHGQGRFVRVEFTVFG